MLLERDDCEERRKQQKSNGRDDDIEPAFSHRLKGAERRRRQRERSDLAEAGNASIEPTMPCALK